MSNSKKIGVERKISKSVGSVYQTCRDAISQRLKYAFNLDLGVGVVWRGQAGEFGQFDDGSGAIWLSSRKAIWPQCAREATGKCGDKDPYLLVGGNLRFGSDETVSTGDETAGEQEADTWAAWMGLEYNTVGFQAAAMVGYSDTKFSSTEFDQFSNSGERWLISADFKMTDTTWLALSYGEAVGSIDALDGERFLVTLKYSEPDDFNLASK